MGYLLLIGAFLMVVYTNGIQVQKLGVQKVATATAVTQSKLAALSSLPTGTAAMSGWSANIPPTPSDGGSTTAAYTPPTPATTPGASFQALVQRYPIAQPYTSAGYNYSTSVSATVVSASAPPNLYATSGNLAAVKFNAATFDAFWFGSGAAVLANPMTAANAPVISLNTDTATNLQYPWVATP